MRYQITAREELGTLERRHYTNNEGHHFTLDIRWSDALFYADEVPAITEASIRDGRLLNDLEEFDVEYTSDGDAELNFDDDFPEKEKNAIEERWNTIGDDAFHEYRFDLGDTEYFIFGEIDTFEFHEDED